MNRNTPFGRDTSTANLMGLLISILIAAILVGLDVGILPAILTGFVSGLLLSFIVFRYFRKERQP